MKFNVTYYNKRGAERSPNTLKHKFWKKELGKNDRATYLYYINKLKEEFPNVRNLPKEINLKIRKLPIETASINKDEVISVDTDFIAGDHYYPWDVAFSICHELGHLQQMRNLHLVMHGGYIWWKGKVHCFSDINNLDCEEYNNLPWEKDADKRGIKLMKKLFPDEYEEMKNFYTEDQ